MKSYISGGLLGDFLHQLSVVKENYINTGEKGIVYISNNVGDKFRKPIEQTYQELKDLLINSDYIEELKIDNMQSQVDTYCNLSDWRLSNLLYKDNWFNIFNSVYNIKWGKNKWIDIKETNDYFRDKILINYSTTRPYNGNLNFNEFNKTKLLFISFDVNDYLPFRQLVNIDIPFCKVNTLYDMGVAINSCELFIGGLSSPLALCIAMHKKCIANFNNDLDGIHMKNISTYLPFLKEHY